MIFVLIIISWVGIQVLTGYQPSVAGFRSALSDLRIIYADIYSSV